MHAWRNRIGGHRRCPRGRGVVVGAVCRCARAVVVAAVCLAALAWTALPAHAQSAGICGRSTLVRASILSKLGVTGCAQVTAQQLSTIRLFTLDRYSLPQAEWDGPFDLQAGDFDGLTGLVTLTANESRIRSVPAGLFAATPNLTKIAMRDNQIETLPADFIKGLTKLYILRLNGNSIARLPEGFFSGLTPDSRRQPGYEFRLALSDTELEVTLVPFGARRFAAYMPTGAPFDVRIAYGSSDRTYGHFTLRTGDTMSEQGAFRVKFMDIRTVSHPPRQHSGYRITKAADLPLDIQGNDFSPNAWMSLNVSPSSVTEGGVATVSARRSTRGHDEARLQVYAFAKPDHVYTLPRTTPLDFTVGENRMLTIPIDATESTGSVTITTTDDDRYTWSRQVNVAARPIAGQIQIPSVVTMSIEENEPRPTIRLVPSRSSMSEEAGSIQVTAELDAPLAALLQLWVTVQPRAPTRHYHYDLAGGNRLVTIPAGETSSTFTITAVDDSAFVGDRDLWVGAFVTFYDAYDYPNDPTPLILRILEDDPEQGAGEGICARTAGVRTVLLRAVDGVTDCAEVTAAHLAAVETLSISGYYRYADRPDPDAVIVNDLRRGDFDGLTNLSYLYIASTLIDRLPAGLFDGLANLEMLQIDGNEDLRDVEAGAFSGLPKLRRLWFHGNNVQGVSGSGRLRLPAGVFADLTALTELDLSSNRFGSRLDPGTFAGLANLVHLDLSHNSITELPAGIFDGLSSLKALRLDFNYLGELPDGIFSDLTSLVAVRMINSWGRTMPDGLFEGMPALRFVMLADGYDNRNWIRTFPDRIFYGLSAPLRYLEYGAHHTPPLEISLQALGPGRFRAAAPAGAPFDIVLPVSAANGTISGGAATLTIPAGAVASGELEVTRDAGTSAAVTVDIGDLPALPPERGYRIPRSETFGIDSFGIPGHFGYQLAKVGELPLIVIAGTGAPPLMLQVEPATIPEDGGAATVTAHLPAVANPAAEEIRLAVSAAPVAPAAPGDYTLSDPQLTIAAGGRNATGTVTIAAVNNDRYTGNRTLRVSAAVTAGDAALPAVRTVTITDDEPPPEVALELSADTIAEAGGKAHVSAALSGPPGAPVVLSVTTEPVAPALRGDYLQSGGTLTIAPGVRGSTGTVTITAVDDPADRPDKLLQVRASVAGLPGLSAPAERTLTITDGDGPPTAWLLLDPTQVSEGRSSTVTARLSHASSEPSVLRVTSVRTTPDTSFTQDGSTLTFAAGQTDSAGTVTITAGEDAQFQVTPRTVEVGAQTTSGPAGSPPAVTLTIEENDPAPAIVNQLQLVLDPRRIPEDGGQSVVTAQLAAAVYYETIITVAAAAAGWPASNGDFTLSGTALTIAAGQTDSTGTVTVSAQDNTEFTWDKIINVTARVSSIGANAIIAESLTIEEDDPRPVVTFDLSHETIGENGEITEIRARLDRAVSRDTYLRIRVESVPPARSGFDYEVAGDRLQAIRRGETQIGQIGFGALEPVTVRGKDDIIYTGDKQVRVTAQVDRPYRALPWIEDPLPHIITITDNDPQAPGDGICARSLEVQHAIKRTVSGDPACQQVTARQLGEIAKLNVVGMRSLMSLVPGDFDGMPNLEALSFDSYWRDVRVADWDHRVTYNSLRKILPRLFSGDLDRLTSLTFYLTAVLTIPADLVADLPNLEVLTFDRNKFAAALPKGMLADSRKLKTFSFTTGGLYTLPSGFFQGATALESISLNVNSLTSLPEGIFSGLRRVHTINLSENYLQSLPRRVFAGLPALREVRVTSPVLSNEPYRINYQTLYLMTRLPEAAFEGLSGPLDTLVLDRVSLEVSLRADGPGRLRAVAPSGAPFDIVLPVSVTGGSIAGGLTSLTIPAGALDSEAVAVTRTANTTGPVTADIGELPGLPAGHSGYDLIKVALPLTVIGADGAPAVTLELSEPRIREAGGAAAVTARLSSPAAAEVRLAVTVSPVAPATHDDFRVSETRILTIAANATGSSNTVTVTARDNDRYAGRRSLAIAAAVTAGNAGVPVPVTLEISEDEPPPPPIALKLSASSIPEAGGSALVTALSGVELDVPMTLRVSVTADAPAVGRDFTLTGTTLTIAAEQTRSTGTVRIDATNDDVHAPDRTLRIGAVLSGVSGVPAPPERTLTIEEDEATPAVALVLSDEVIDEDGGSVTVNATLHPASGAATTVTVTVEPVAPAVAEDFEQQGTELTFAPGSGTSSGMVRITALDNAADAPHRRVRVRAVAHNEWGVSPPSPEALVIVDDDPAPVVSLRVVPDAIGEQGGPAAVSADLNHPTSKRLILTVTAEAVPPALATEFTQGGASLTIAARQTASTGTVTIAGVDDASYLGAKQVRVTAQVAGQVDVAEPEPVTLTIEDDEMGPVVTLVLEPDQVSEEAGTATVTASITPPVNEPLAITVEAVPVAPAAATDLSLSANRVLTIGAGASASHGTVTITTAGNNLASPSKTVRITGKVLGPRGLLPREQVLTILDDEPLPNAALELSSSTVGENGDTATVTAMLDQAAGVDTFLRVTAAPVPPAADADFRQQGTMLTIPAGTTGSTGEVTITARDNDLDAPDRSLTVGAVIAAGYANAPPARTLTITNDEVTPVVQLLLSSGSISERDGVSSVTARLDHPSSEPTAVTVTAAAGDQTTDVDDFTLSANRVLSIAAGARDSTGTVTITAVDENLFRPDRSVAVAGTASNARRVTSPAGRTLAIEEDELPPEVTLHLSAPSIAETGAATVTVTVRLQHALDRVTTYTVAAAPVARAFGEVNLSANRVLTVTAEDVESTGTVTITAVDDDIDAPDTTVLVTAAVHGLRGLPAPAPVALTVTDDDDAPAVTLVRSAESIEENGGAARISAALAHRSSAETTVRVAAAPVAPAMRDDFRQDGTLLVVAARATASTATVTVTAVDNDTDAPDRTVTVSATAANAQGVAGDPAPVAIEIKDDEAAPTVRLVLDPGSIDENGGASRVTALLDHPSSEATAVTVATTPAGAAWYRQEGGTLTIAAGARASTGTVRIVPVDDDLYEPGRTVTVTGSAVNGQGVTSPEPRTLAIEEDEPVPTVTLFLSHDRISEQRGATTVTAGLDRSVHVRTTYRVSARAVAPGVPGGFTLSANRMLTIAAGHRNSTGAVTITAQPDDVDAPDRDVRVTAAVDGHALAAPAAPKLTIADDDESPALTLMLSPDSIGERRWETLVSAKLDHPSSASTTVRVAVRPVPPAVQGDFRQFGATLTIPAGATSSSGRASIRAVDNDVDAPDKIVEVSAQASNPQGLAAVPEPVRLAIVDDDAAPLVRLRLTPRRISERDETSRVTAWIGHPSSEDTTVTVTAAAVGVSSVANHEMSSETKLTIAAGARTSTGEVTITAKDNTLYGADRFVTVSGNAQNTQGISDPRPVTLTIEENERVPEVRLHLSTHQAPGGRVAIGEHGGQAPVTVSIDRSFDRETTYTISAAAVPPAVADDFTLSGPTVLTIPAEQMEGTGTLTITARNNDTDAPDKEVQVTAVVGGFAGVPPPNARTLTIEDDEEAPGVSMSLSATELDERGQLTALTATLDHRSSEDTRLLVDVRPDPPAVAADLRLARTVLIVPARALDSDQLEIRAVDNDVDAPTKTLTITAAAHNVQGIAGHPASRSLTVIDDEAAPAVSLTLSPLRIVENGGKSTVTARLDHPSSAHTVVSVGTEPASATWFTRGGAALTIAAGRRTSTGVVRITAVNNDQDATDRTVTVTGAAANTHGVAGDPPAQVLTIEDDENTPTVHLDLNPRTIIENGEQSAVTARLDHTSGTETVVTVAAEPAGVAWYRQSGTRLTIAAGGSSSTGTVTITAVGDQEDGPDRTVTLSASVTSGSATPARPPARLTIADDDGTPTVWLDLGSASIAEGGSTTVTARMSAASSRGVSMRIAYNPDLILSANPVLRIAGGQTVSTASVTITAPDDMVHGAQREVTLRPTLFNAAGGIVAPAPVPLTITEDDPVPGVTLELSEIEIPENGGETTVTAWLDRLSTSDTTVAVGTAAVGQGSYFTQHGSTLTIPAGSLWSRGRVRITALDNDVDETGRTVRVTGTATNDLGVTLPPDLDLAITDDDPTPTVALALTPDTVSESVVEASTVTATLSGSSAEEMVLTVASRLARVRGGNARFTQTGATLTIPAGRTDSIGRVTITPVDDTREEADKTVLVTATATGGLGVAPPAEQALTIVDDDEEPVVTLHIRDREVSEGLSTRVWAQIAHPWPRLLYLDFRTAGHPFEMELDEGDCSAIRPGVSSHHLPLRILSSQLRSCDSLVLRIPDDDVDEADEVIDLGVTVVIGLHPSTWQGDVPRFPRFVILDDDDPPPVRLALSDDDISENGGSATLSATLDWPSGEPTTVDLALTWAGGVVPARLTRTRLTIPARANQSTGAEIVALNNGVDAPDVIVTVTGSARNSLGIEQPAAVMLTVRDDDPAPAVRLLLAPAAIREDGGVSMVTAALDRASSAPVTVTVGATAVAPAMGADFTLSGNQVLSIAARHKESTGVVTITAHNDELAGHKQVQVAGTATGGAGIAAPAVRILTIRDDESAPVLTLQLSEATIPENGGSTRVSAALGYAASVDTTVTVTAAAVAPATGADFMLSANKVLSIAARQTESTGVVTIAARNDNLVSPHKQVRVGATVTGGGGVAPPTAHTLVIEDDEPAPVLAVVLNPDAIAEGDGASAVTATLSPAPGVQRTVTVTAVPLAPAAIGDFTLSGATLTFAAAASASSGALTITAHDNVVYAPDKRITVTAAADGFRAAAPATGTLTIVENDAALTVSLNLSRTVIAEPAGASLVTAELSGAVEQDVTITVTAEPLSTSVASYFTQAGATLTIIRGEQVSRGRVRIAVEDNAADEPDREVRVTGTISGAALSPPEPRTLTVKDDDGTPRVELKVSPDTIAERGGTAAVTVQLDRPSSERTTVEVSAQSDAGAAAFSLSENRVLTIPAGTTSSTGTLTVTAVDDNADQPNTMVRVSATAHNDHAIFPPVPVQFTISDDDPTPILTLRLDPDDVSEQGGAATVTAQLDRPSSDKLLVTVAADATDPHVPAGFRVSADPVLTIAAGVTNHTGTVTITAMSSDRYTGDRTVRVTGEPSSPDSAGTEVAPAEPLTLTIRDVQSAPTVSLALSAAEIAEAGGSATVTASVTGADVGGQVRLRVTAVPVPPAKAVDFAQTGTMLTIRAGRGTSTGAVTIAAVDDDLREPPEGVRLDASVEGLPGLTAPASRTLTIADDEEDPALTLELSRTTVGENGGISIVTAALNTALEQDVELAVTATPGSAGSADFSLSPDRALTIRAGDKSSRGLVVVTAVDDDLDEPPETLQVGATATAGGLDITAPAARTLTIVEGEATPGLTLHLDPAEISEGGGTSTVTARLAHHSGEQTTLKITATAFDPATGNYFTLNANPMLTIAAGASGSTGTVTITALDDQTEGPRKLVRVAGQMVSGGNGVDPPEARILKISDDDGLPTLTLALTPGTINERGGVSTVTASLSGVTNQATTALITVSPVGAAEFTDLELSANPLLTIAANAIESTGTVTITAVDNPDDGPDKQVLVGAQVAGGNGVAEPIPVTLTVEDDEQSPAVTLHLAANPIGEHGGSSAVTASLAYATSAETVLAVTAAALQPSAVTYFTQTGSTLTIAANELTSTGDVTITARNDDLDGPTGLSACVPPHRAATGWPIPTTWT